MVTKSLKLHVNFWQAISGALGALGTVGSTLLGNRANANLNNTNRGWQTSERIAQQDWQNEQRLAQNQFAEDMYNKYESPQAMVNQLTAAGLNPRLASDGNIGSVQASSGSSGGAPSGQSPATTPMQFANLSGGFHDMAAALGALAQAKKAGAETKSIESLLDVNVKRAFVDLYGQELLNSMNATKLRYMDQREAAEVAQIIQNISNLEASEQETRQNFKNLAKLGLIYDKDIETYMDKWLTQKANMESSTDKNRQDIEESKQNVEESKQNVKVGQSIAALNWSKNTTENEIRDWLVKEYKGKISVQKAEYIGRALKNVFLAKTGSEEIKQDKFNKILQAAGNLVNFDIFGYDDAIGFAELLFEAEMDGNTVHYNNYGGQLRTKTIQLQNGNLKHLKSDGSWYVTDKKGKVVQSSDR